MSWIKVFCEQWLLGSTRFELTHEQRAIFIDILVRAGLNDPPGQVNFVSFEQLAANFAAPIELVEGTVNRGVETDKFQLKKKRE